MEDDIMNQLIMALLVLSAIFFVLGGLSRFLRFQILGHEPTVWWRDRFGRAAPPSAGGIRGASLPPGIVKWTVYPLYFPVESCTCSRPYREISSGITFWVLASL